MNRGVNHQIYMEMEERKTGSQRKNNDKFPEIFPLALYSLVRKEMCG